MKCCPKCHEYKSEEQFTKSKRSKDGLNCWCRNCTRVNSNRGYLLKRQQRLAKVKKYRTTDKGKQVNSEAIKRWLDKNPKKYIAHYALRMAVRLGVILVKPCQNCGQIEGVHAHHNDYDRVFDVIWLCPQHHKEIERLNNEKS